MKHCILAKYKAEVDEVQKEELIERIQEVFEPLIDFDGIHGIELIPNVVNRPNRYDLLIRIDMEEDALPVYDESEPHKRWKSEFSELLEKKAIFDYEEADAFDL